MVNEWIKRKVKIELINFVADYLKDKVLEDKVDLRIDQKFDIDRMEALHLLRDNLNM